MMDQGEAVAQHKATSAAEKLASWELELARRTSSSPRYPPAGILALSRPLAASFLMLRYHLVGNQ